MRFLIHAKIPTEDGNKMVQDPNFSSKLKYINKVKAEATYFFEADGDRVAAFIVDIQSADQIPVLAEPLFGGMGAQVEFHPVMSLDDLKKAMPQAVLEVNCTVSKTQCVIMMMAIDLSSKSQRTIKSQLVSSSI
jgi:hypothetical protein